MKLSVNKMCKTITLLAWSYLFVSRFQYLWLEVRKSSGLWVDVSRRREVDTGAGFVVLLTAQSSRTAAGAWMSSRRHQYHHRHGGAPGGSFQRRRVNERLIVISYILHHSLIYGRYFLRFVISSRINILTWLALPWNDEYRKNIVFLSRSIKNDGASSSSSSSSVSEELCFFYKFSNAECIHFSLLRLLQSLHCTGTVWETCEAVLNLPRGEKPKRGIFFFLFRFIAEEQQRKKIWKETSENNFDAGIVFWISDSYLMFFILSQIISKSYCAESEKRRSW